MGPLELLGHKDPLVLLASRERLAIMERLGLRDHQDFPVSLVYQAPRAVMADQAHPGQRDSRVTRETSDPTVHPGPQELTANTAAEAHRVRKERRVSWATRESLDPGVLRALRDPKAILVLLVSPALRANKALLVSRESLASLVSMDEKVTEVFRATQVCQVNPACKAHLARLEVRGPRVNRAMLDHLESREILDRWDLRACRALLETKGGQDPKDPLD